MKTLFLVIFILFATEVFPQDYSTYDSNRLEVKIFKTKNDYGKLQKQVNKFLQADYPLRIIDIQYDIEYQRYGDIVELIYTVLIVYLKKE